MNGRLTTGSQIDSGMRVTFDSSIEMPVTPPSMKLLDRRNPWRPMLAREDPESDEQYVDELPPGMSSSADHMR